MKLEDLIERGYFPKELPPPFNTERYAHHVSSVLPNWQAIFDNNTAVSSPTFVLTQAVGETNSDYNWRKQAHASAFRARYNNSQPTIFSISKSKLARRFLGIPNPNHYLLLADKIVDNWSEFEKVYALSDYSSSCPLPESDEGKRSVSTVSKSVADFRNELLNTSLTKAIQLRVDISKFYPTIYTHSIAWALLGREKAKSYFRQRNNLASLIAAGDADAALYKKAEEIDTALRACQEKQSIGIPIGPDTSHILAEGIACRIDSMLKEQFEKLGLKARRYYDDYYIYVSTKDLADQVLKGLQLILNSFRLEINEGKVRIQEFPIAIEERFTSELFLFSFKDTNLTASLRHYFSLIWQFVEEDPKHADWIFRYSLKVFEFSSISIPKGSWRIFEDLLFKTALMEPSILDIVTRLLLTYRSYLDAQSKVKLKELLNAILLEHCRLNHNFEMSWALWIAKTFEIEVGEACANMIIDTGDSIANLILLDMIKHTALVEGAPKTGLIEAALTDDLLFSEQWLLAYEGVKKGWLKPHNVDLLQDNHFFKLLDDLDVEFYDGDRQLKTFTPKAKSKAASQSLSAYELYAAMEFIPSNFL